MLPTRRFYLLLLLGLAIAPILSLVVGLRSAIAALIILDSLVFLLAILDALRVKPHRLKLERQLNPRLSIGRDNPVTLSLHSGKRPIRVKIRDGYPLEFTVSSTELEATLPANSTRELTYTVRPFRRGESLWEGIRIRQLGAWGLAWHQWQIQQQQTIPVYPDLIGLRSLSIRLALENTGAMRQVRNRGQGTEFAELREYRRGDDLRSINWKATARWSRPLVKVLEPEKEQTLIILLDRGRLMTARVQKMQRFDWGLNATLALALAGLSRGDKVGVGVFERDITLWIPPQSGQSHFSTLLERLTPLQPILQEPNYFDAVSRLVEWQTRRALVVVITEIVDRTASVELLSAMTRLSPRYLPFCVTLRDPLVDEIAHHPTQKVEATYARAVALDLLTQREIAFEQLKRRGVLVLDAPANQISDRLVDRYLQLKARSLL